MKYLLTLAALSMTACLDTEKTEDTSSTDDSNFAPKTGTWLVPEPEITVDTCGMGGGGDDSGYTPEPDEMEISLNADGTYSAVLSAGEDPLSFVCSLSGHNFSCATDMTMSLTENSTLLQSIAFDGAFSSDSEFSGDLAMNIDCEGADCDAIAGQMGASFPCSMTGILTASYTN